MLFSPLKYFIQNKVVALALLFLICLWGLYYAPFGFWEASPGKNAVSVDAIPDIGDNQQIVYTEWEGQSPQEIENQITYPLTSHLLGIPGVRTVRSSSMFGYSSIYIIFEDDIDFYWSRSRILEKLNSLPAGLLPPEASPALGPDATALGQVFWYTIEGRDQNGKVVGGWDLHELRSVQDFFLRDALVATPGISEIASIGGFVKEYQIDLNPELMKRYGVRLIEVVEAVRESNQDVGAKTLEINRVEYFVRGLGYIEDLQDIENIKVGGTEYTPILLKDVANISLGPAERRGILDKKGAEVVGGVAVVQHGANPMEAVRALKKSIERIEPGMPSKVLADGRISKLSIIPFYDRTVLIEETLDTLNRTLVFEILITILVVVLMLSQLRVSLVVSSLMPIVVLAVFGIMKLLDVEANILSLSGIAIAIGTLVDMAIILTENIVRRQQQEPSLPLDETVYKATREVSGAILTAGLTTIVGFIPVFSLTGAEGKLFTPLAITKTAALFVAVLVTLLLLPPVVSLFLRSKPIPGRLGFIPGVLLICLGVLITVTGYWMGIGVVLFGIVSVLKAAERISHTLARRLMLVLVVLLILSTLAYYWSPLGISFNLLSNFAFVVLLVFIVLGIIFVFRRYYEKILVWALSHKWQFMSIPLIFVSIGILFMLNTEREFMPSLNEGSLLLMPVSMPHAGITENQEVLRYLDMAVANLPEVSIVVGKAGRVSSALDPAPLSMYENLIQYKSEYLEDSNGRPVKFATNESGEFKTRSGQWVMPAGGHREEDLIRDSDGSYYRNWRPHIHSEDDIWEEIRKVTALPGITAAPKLQPIETRLVMLQTGMRAPIGIKIKGQDLNEIEDFGLELESHLKGVAGIDPSTVFAERIVSKPYMELRVDREKAARYGLSVVQVQDLIEVAIGGKVLTSTVEGRERYGVRVRYPRELRGSPEDLAKIYVDIADKASIPLSEVADVQYHTGPQQIKSEDGFLVGHVIFDKVPGVSEVTAVENARAHLEELIESGSLDVPANISFEFSGNYVNQQRAEARLSIVIPVVLLVIFLILYIQFRSASVSLMVFSAIVVSFAGGFILIGLYAQPWFMNFDVLGINFREYFQIGEVNLSVAVWVGFIALFGIATDDGVVMASYLGSTFRKNRPSNLKTVRSSVLEAGQKRLRPCLMTTATTILALIPILTSVGRGSDVMIPMAIPCLGGMFMTLLSLFMVPVLFSWREELKLKKWTK